MSKGRFLLAPHMCVYKGLFCHGNKNFHQGGRQKTYIRQWDTAEYQELAVTQILQYYAKPSGQIY
jgi:hypothetical protein